MFALAARALAAAKVVACCRTDRGQPVTECSFCANDARTADAAHARSGRLFAEKATRGTCRQWLPN